MILITGMHRSGTSLVTMTLEDMGVYIGDHSRFYEADQWNAKGYFERRDVMDINSRMITGFDRTGSRMSAWVGQAIYLTEPHMDRIVRRGSRYAVEMSQVAAEIGGGAVKDPRLCLTWAAWAETVDIDACVVCIRHPYEVADSLRRRQRIPMKLGLRFWRYHMRALRERTPQRMVVVDLKSMIHDPEPELGMLAGELGLEIDGDEAARRFQRTYTPGMAKTGGELPALDAETQDLWDWLVDHRPIPIFER